MEHPLPATQSRLLIRVAGHTLRALRGRYAWTGRPRTRFAIRAMRVRRRREWSAHWHNPEQGAPITNLDSLNGPNNPQMSQVFARHLRGEQRTQFQSASTSCSSVRGEASLALRDEKERHDGNEAGHKNQNASRLRLHALCDCDHAQQDAANRHDQQQPTDGYSDEGDHECARRLRQRTIFGQRAFSGKRMIPATTDSVQAGVLSFIRCRMEAFEFRAGIVSGELPVHLDRDAVAGGLPGRRPPGEPLDAVDAARAGGGRKLARLRPAAGEQPVGDLPIFVSILSHARSALHWPFGGAGQATPNHTRIIPRERPNVKAIMVTFLYNSLSYRVSGGRGACRRSGRNSPSEAGPAPGRSLEMAALHGPARLAHQAPRPFAREDVELWKKGSFRDPATGRQWQRHPEDMNAFFALLDKPEIMASQVAREHGVVRWTSWIDLPSPMWLRTHGILTSGMTCESQDQGRSTHDAHERATGCGQCRGKGLSSGQLASPAAGWRGEGIGRAA